MRFYVFVQAILIFLSSYSLRVAATDLSEIYFTVHKVQTLYSAPGYDFKSFRDSPLSEDQKPKRSWVQPGTQLIVEDVKEVAGDKYVKVGYIPPSDPKRKIQVGGWMKFEYLYYKDDGKHFKCPPELLEKLKAQAKETLASVLEKNPPRKYRSPPLTASFKKKGADCTDYIKPDGSYGERGKLAAKEILGEGQSSDRWGYFSSNQIDGIRSICPNFNKFRDDQKLNFWIWMLAAMAWDEGKCRSDIINMNATNGIAAGDLQMPEDFKNDREWRGPGCNAKHARVPGVFVNGKKTGASYYMANYENSIPCAIEVLGGAICGFYSKRAYPLKCDESEEFKSRPLMGKHLYWEKLRHPGKGNILAMTKEFPLCKGVVR